MPKNAAKKSPGRGRGWKVKVKEDPSSPTPSRSRSPSDGEDAGFNASRASSVPSVAACVASTHSRPTLAKKRAKKTQFCLDVHEEQVMCDFLRENTILWDTKKTDYRRVDKKAKLWKDQDKVMGKSVEHLQGWFKSLRDTHTRLDKKKSGDGAPEMTEREQWVMANFGFLKPVVRHRAEPVNNHQTVIGWRGHVIGEQKKMDGHRGRDIPVKAFLGLCRDGSSPKEVRRFTLPPWASFSELTAGIATAFPTLGSRFILHYRDDEGDLVTFSSDAEWQEVVQNRPDRLMRIFIKVDKKEMRQEGAAEQATGNSSQSAPCTGEQQQPADPGSSAGHQQKRKNRWGGCSFGDGSSWTHSGVVCDGCEGPVVGMRYKCTVCPNYDLCSKCKVRGLHAEHVMCETPFPAHHWGFCGPRGHHMRWNSAWAGCFPPGGPRGPHGPHGPHGPYGLGPHGRGPHAPPFFQFCATPCDPHFFSGPATEEGGTASYCDPNEEFLHTVGENVAAMLDPFGINVTVDVDHNGVHTRCASTGQGTKTWTGTGKEKSGTDSHPDTEAKQDKSADSKEQTTDVQMTSSDEEWTHVATDAQDDSTDGVPQPSTVADAKSAGGQEPKPLNEKAKMTTSNEGVDKRLAEALSQMLSMGFGDENGELSRLLLSRNCDVSSAIDALATVHSSSGIKLEEVERP